MSSVMVAERGNVSTGVSAADATLANEGFAHAATMLVLVSLFSKTLYQLENYFFGNVSARIALQAQRDFYASVTRQEVGYFEQKTLTAGSVIGRLNQGCRDVGKMMSKQANECITSAIMVTGAFFSMMAISWRLALIPLAVVPLTSYLAQLRQEDYWALYRKYWKTEDLADDAVNEAIGDIRTVKMFACEEYESQRYNRLAEANFELKSKLFYNFGVQLRAWLLTLSENAMLFTILFYGAYLARADRLEPSAIVTFLLFQSEFSQSYARLLQLCIGFFDKLRSTRRLFSAIHRQPRIRLDGCVVATSLHDNMMSIKGHVEFRHVTFSYPSRSDTKVLNKICFEARPGETVALVGPNGAGKSTVVALLKRFYEPSGDEGGEILLDSVPIAEYETQFYHQQVALVPQEPSLYSGSVRSNILYGYQPLNGESSQEQETRLVEAARLAGIHSFIASCPQGYDTLCGEKGLQLSGGQKQRIAIARALVREPPVLILDEATSAMDSETEWQIREAIQRCSVGRTVIIIAHRLSTVERADRILVFDNGCIIQSGIHAELISNEEGRYAWFGGNNYTCRRLRFDEFFLLPINTLNMHLVKSKTD